LIARWDSNCQVECSGFCSPSTIRLVFTLHPLSKMATFFEELYHKLFSPLSSLSSPSTTPPTFFLLADDMNPHNDQMYSHPMASHESAIAESTQPGDSSDSASGHFPTSPRSSMSSTGSAPSAALLSGRLTKPVAQPQVKLDPMTRVYPKPTTELNLDELLARTPGKWSVAHYVKNARDLRIPVMSAAEQAKDFEETKKELLRRAKEDMQLPANRRV